MKFGYSTSLPNPYVTYPHAMLLPKGNVFEKTLTIAFGVLEIPLGVDVVKRMWNFAQSTKVSVTVLGGFSLLSEVDICPASQLSPINFVENLTFMSLTGFFCMSETFVSCSYAATLARMDGTIIGGQVSRLVTKAPVVLTMVIFNDTKFMGGDSKILARL